MKPKSCPHQQVEPEESLLTTEPPVSEAVTLRAQLEAERQLRESYQRHYEELLHKTLQDNIQRQITAQEESQNRNLEQESQSQVVDELQA